VQKFYTSTKIYLLVSISKSTSLSPFQHMKKQTRHYGIILARFLRRTRENKFMTDCFLKGWKIQTQCSVQIRSDLIFSTLYPHSYFKSTHMHSQKLSRRGCVQVRDPFSFSSPSLLYFSLSLKAQNLGVQTKRALLMH